jgi:hypothetical protein
MEAQLHPPFAQSVVRVQLGLSVVEVAPRNLELVAEVRQLRSRSLRNGLVFQVDGNNTRDRGSSLRRVKRTRRRNDPVQPGENDCQRQYRRDQNGS